MDSFEASTQFSQILRNLNPSLPSLTKAAHFALKNSESEDYLFPSIMNILDDPNTELNTKSTIFQFIELLIRESFNASQQPKPVYNFPYVQSLKAALPGILLKILPNSNNSNSFNVYNSLKNISQTFKFDSSDYISQYNSNLLNEEDLENIESNIPFPSVDIEDQPDSSDSIVNCWSLLIQKKKQSQYERQRMLKHSPVINERVDENQLFELKDKNDKNNELLSKRQVILRMEDDRETHKKSKETLWVVNRPKESNVITEDEFLMHYWNKLKGMNEEEEKAFSDTLEELNKMVADSYKDKQF